MSRDVVDAYVRLGLSYDRLVRGSVDVWTGPDVVRAEVESGPVPHAADLDRRAGELLAELPSAGLAAARARWLAAQLTALACTARVLAGEPVAYLAQVEACYQVRPELGDEATYADAHAELDRLLPGSGPLLERYTDHREAQSVPRERLGDAVRGLSALLRERARGCFALPDEELVRYRVVTGRPWAGLSSYLGGYRSDVAVNADVPVGLGTLPALVAHEAYPGHHTERCRKQAARPDRPEHHLSLVSTPENVVAEGLADLGLAALELEDWGPVVTEVYADLGLAYDGELGQRIARAAAPLRSVRQDAALLLHDRGAPVERVETHLTRWGLQPPARARRTIGFVTHPLWRTYTTTYVEGERLLAGWLEARPAGVTVAERFGRLLDEPLTPAGLQEELVVAPRSPGRARVAGGEGAPAA